MYKEGLSSHFSVDWKKKLKLNYIVTTAKQNDDRNWSWTCTTRDVLSLTGSIYSFIY